MITTELRKKNIPHVVVKGLHALKPKGLDLHNYWVVTSRKMVKNNNLKGFRQSNPEENPEVKFAKELDYNEILFFIKQEEGHYTKYVEPIGELYAYKLEELKELVKQESNKVKKQRK